MLDPRHPLYQLALTQLSLPSGWMREVENPRIQLQVPPPRRLEDKAECSDPPEWEASLRE